VASSDVAPVASGRDHKHATRLAVAATSSVIALWLLLAAWASRWKVPGNLLRDDYTLLELRVLSIGHSWVLLGPYSRFGWMQPGPLLFYLLWAPYHIAGGGVVGIMAGTLIIDIASVLGCLSAAAVIGGRRLVLLTAALSAAFVLAFWPWVAAPWNPVTPLFALLLVLLCSWGTAEEHWPLLAVGIAAGSFAIQSHIGYAPVTAVALGAGMLFGSVRAWRSRRDDPAVFRRFVRWCAVAIVIGAALWTPTIVEQLTHDPGNAGLIVQSLSAGGSHPTAPQAARSVLNELTVSPEWLTFSNWKHERIGALSNPPGTLGIPIIGIIFMGAALVAIRRRGSPRSLFVIIASSLAAATVAIARIQGPAFEYLYLWLQILGLAAWLALMWFGLDLMRMPRNTRDRRVGSILFGGLVLVGGFAALRQFSTDSGTGWTLAIIVALALGAVALTVRRPSRIIIAVAGLVIATAITGALLERGSELPNGRAGDPAHQQAQFAIAVADHARSGPRAIHLVWRSTDPVGELPQLVALALSQRGFDVTVPPEYRVPFGPERAHRLNRNETVIRIAPGAPGLSHDQRLAQIGPISAYEQDMSGHGTP
jgi:hypothetical protein